MTMNSMRGGMQVHAVPESERAVDAQGRRLPWGYEFADAELGRRREPEERGPFGRSMRRRGFSRSKTATPARKEDALRLENMQTEDAIFARFKDEAKARDALPQHKSQDAAAAAAAAAAADAPSTREATEVILYGFGPDSQWAAIDYYERVSGGCIYEDYDRHAPHQRYDNSMSYSRQQLQPTLSQAALKKRNTYRGGDHWIKVTFDSPEAADLACHCSPHAVHGFLVYAEPYRGAAPPNDKPIPYSNAGAQIDDDALPKTFSTHTSRLTASPTDSSNTLSSATATFPRTSAVNPFESAAATSTSTALQEQAPIQLRPMRIKGATRAVLKPADQALVKPAPASTLASYPIIGLFFSVKGDVIGSQVPRLDDGSFDWKNASFYWRFFAWLDLCLGTDMCGLKGDD